MSPAPYAALLAALRRRISGRRALAALEAIHRSDVRSTASAYLHTARFVAALLSRLGVREVELVWHRADGRTPVSGWRPSPAWEAVRGRLRIEHPGSLRGTLARYPEVPTSLSVNSPSTPPGGVRGALVLESALRRPGDAKGKFVLTDGFPSSRRARYAGTGALGVVSDRAASIGPGAGRPANAVTWDNSWHQPWPVPGGPGFMVSAAAGARLRRALRRGTAVRLHADVSARNHQGKLASVTGVIPGRDRGLEVAGIAHLFEVGANDNASGAAALIEAARALVRLNRARRFRRTVRLVFPHECFGTLAWLRRRRKVRLAAGLNLDMVGERQSACRSVLGVHGLPDSAPGFADALATDIVRAVAGSSRSFRWKKRGFLIDDNAFLTDPLVGCPTPLLLHSPDRFYHSQLDTPGRASAASLARAGLVAGTYLGWLAGAGTDDLSRLIGMTVDDSLRRLKRGSGAARGAPAREAAFRLDRASARLDSVLALAGRSRDRLRPALAAARRRLAAAAGPGLRAAPPARRRSSTPAGRRIPVRLAPGIPALDGREDLKRSIAAATGHSLPWSTYLVSALFWANGRRTVDEIAEALKFEHGSGDPRRVSRFFELLAAGGLVRFR